MISVKNAKKLIEDYDYLIGEDYSGGTIEALIITPRNDPEFSEAIGQYSRTFDSSLIYPASGINSYTVTAILDRKRIDAQGLLLHAELFNILSKKNIEINYEDYGIQL